MQGPLDTLMSKDKLPHHKIKSRNNVSFYELQGKSLNSAVEAKACSETLCGVRTISQLLEKLPNICILQEAEKIDATKDWSSAKNWAQWWTRSTHLKMLSAAFTETEKHVWHHAESYNNECVERKS